MHRPPNFIEHLSHAFLHILAFIPLQPVPAPRGGDLRTDIQEHRQVRRGEPDLGRAAPPIRQALARRERDARECIPVSEDGRPPREVGRDRGSVRVRASLARRTRREQNGGAREFPAVGGEEQVDGVVVQVGFGAEVRVDHLPDGCRAVWEGG